MNSRPVNLKTSTLPTEPKSQDRKSMKSSNFIHFFLTMVPFFVKTEGRGPNVHLNRPLELT